MRLNDIASKLALKSLTPQVTRPDSDITAGYVSDLLSDVLANAPRDGVLVTVQVHLNVIAVAVHAELSAVIFALDRVPDETVVAKAVEEGIALYVTDKPAWQVVGKLYELGIHGQ